MGLGAPLMHLVDFDGARTGAPANLEVVGAVASRIATPIQLAGGLEGAGRRSALAFAAGATRVVLALGVVDEPQRSCASAWRSPATGWPSGLDPRPERLAAFRVASLRRRRPSPG